MRGLAMMVSVLSRLTHRPNGCVCISDVALNVIPLGTTTSPIQIRDIPVGGASLLSCSTVSGDRANVLQDDALVAAGWLLLVRTIEDINCIGT